MRTDNLPAIDHENFSFANLPAYEATARAYSIIAKAYAMAALLAETAAPDFVANFLDAQIGAEQYADHCDGIVKLARSGEDKDWIVAYDCKYGVDSQTLADIWISEADITPEELREELDDMSSAPAADNRHSPLDGGTPVPVGALVAV